MAVIHRTVLKPTKLELLTSWLPTRSWYRGGEGAPVLEKAGGFRLDDPQGEVGMEFMVVTDAAPGREPVTYLVPLTYRGAPLDGAEHALVGTMEHGVLGRRWAYDGRHDPVLVAQLLALFEGRVQAQDQNASDVPDLDVVGSYSGEGPLSVDGDIAATLRLCRVLQPAPDGEVSAPRGTVGHVGGGWRLLDGNRARGVFATLGG
ncbi:1,4-alpha-glucan branching protein [Streptomyces sp. NPDC059009]|uniref:maltokinase N-terminal cap-like domain-containing protein n=1 Tax=Streptomyces sp. NPDC059009 TaxID=3346694 RepID=UPI0036C1226B